jgi:hypothetical protein
LLVVGFQRQLTLINRALINLYIRARGWWVSNGQHNMAMPTFSRATLGVASSAAAAIVAFLVVPVSKPSMVRLCALYSAHHRPAALCGIFNARLLFNFC